MPDIALLPVAARWAVWAAVVIVILVVLAAAEMLMESRRR